MSSREIPREIISDAGWWTTAEIAVLLEIPVRTVRYHVTQGWLKAEIRGKSTYIQGRDLKEWLREGVKRRESR